MTYSIAKYTPNYYANTDRLQPIENDRGKTLTFENKQDAQQYIDDNGCCDSEYYITDSEIVEYIGRDGDDSNYDWNDCECSCGNCNTCFQFKVLADLEMIKRAQM